MNPSGASARRHAKRSAVEALLEVGRRVDIAGFGQRFHLRAEIAVGIAFVGRLRALLLLGRQVEEGTSPQPCRIDHRLRNTVIAYCEETCVAADAVNLGAKRLLAAGIGAFEPAEIEYRKCRVLHRLASSVANVGSGNDAVRSVNRLGPTDALVLVHMDGRSAACWSRLRFAQQEHERDGEQRHHHQDLEVVDVGNHHRLQVHHPVDL